MKKLSLTKETVQQLTQQDSERIAGGVMYTGCFPGCGGSKWFGMCIPVPVEL